MRKPTVHKLVASPSGVYHFSGFGDRVTAAVSGRQFINSQYPSFVSSCGAVGPLVRLKQVHGGTIVHVSEKNIPSIETEADGLVTNTPGIVLGIQTADCVPVFYYDAKQKAIGLAHAGWRGIYAGIVVTMVDRMAEVFNSNPGDLSVYFGPSIRNCCYEVGSEFENYFPGFYQKANNPLLKGRIDLIAAAYDSLIRKGIPLESIKDCGVCTSCSNESFFSFRRESTENRILSILQLSV